MDAQTIYELISDVLCEAKDLSPDAITPDTPINQLKLDSLDYVEMIVLMKRHYGITLTGDSFAEKPAMTLGDLCQFIVAKKQDMTV